MVFGCGNVGNPNAERVHPTTNDSLIEAKKYDIDLKYDSVLIWMEPIVRRGHALSGYDRLVYVRNRSDYINQYIEETDSIYKVYLNDGGTGDSRENMLVSYIDFLNSNRLLRLAEYYSDTLVSKYGDEGRYRDMRYMYYFLGASGRIDCDIMHAYLDSLRLEVENQGEVSIIKKDLVVEYTKSTRRKCP